MLNDTVRVSAGSPKRIKLGIHWDKLSDSSLKSVQESRHGQVPHVVISETKRRSEVKDTGRELVPVGNFAVKPANKSHLTILRDDHCQHALQGPAKPVS